MFSVTKPDFMYTIADKPDPMYTIAEMIESISFVPTRTDREALYKQSIAAQKQSNEYEGVGSPNDLITKNPNSKDTGFKTTVFATKQNFAFYCSTEFCIFNTQNFPLIGGSMGPNCVPTCPISINLFENDENTTRASLNRFMTWRKNNGLNILKAYVHSLEQFENPDKKVVFEQSLLSRGREDLEIDVSTYRNVARMFRSILSTLDEKSDFSTNGIKFRSFCQTWMKKGIVGKASFSVPSPHFQTLPYLDISMFPDLPIETVEEYTRLLRVQTYDMTTKIVDGQLEYDKSFVDLDSLYKKMNEKNVFFINSAPNFDTLPLIMEARDSITDGDFYVIVSSSFSEYMTAINAMSPLGELFDESNIKTLPSNFRVTIKPGVKINGVECTQENYSRIQENISSALVTIFSWCNREGIDIFFTSAPRESRPLYLKSPSAINKSHGPKYDETLTLKVVYELVVPALSAKMNAEPSVDLITKALDQYTQHKATYLTDVVSVAVASELLDDESAWYSYELLEEPEVKHAGVKYPWVPTASYFSAKFTRGPGKIRALNPDGYNRVSEVMQKAMSRTEPVWKSCYIMHDEFLNDIDDVVANYLARGLTEKKGFYFFKNYD
jgi:hypothetical protein